MEQHPANSGGNTWLSGLGVQGVGVSHSSALIKDGNRLIIASDTKFTNKTAAESVIRDTDMAKEMVQYSLKNILEQAGNSMMAQANQSNEMVLSLLQ